MYIYLFGYNVNFLQFGEKKFTLIFSCLSPRVQICLNMQHPQDRESHCMVVSANILDWQILVEVGGVEDTSEL